MYAIRIYQNQLKPDLLGNDKFSKTIIKLVHKHKFERKKLKVNGFRASFLT